MRSIIDKSRQPRYPPSNNPIILATNVTKKLDHYKKGIKTLSSGMLSRGGFESVTIPSSVTKIGAYAFFSFSPEVGMLKEVTIRSKKIKEWGKEIFGRARKDLVIKVPKSKKKEYTKALREGGLPEYVKIVS